MSVKTRRAAWAGQFYPAQADHLRSMIRAYLDAVTVTTYGRIVGVVAPHAGYVYSGKTAAVAYRRLQGAAYENAVLLSPSHAAFIEGVSAFDGDFYETPLGAVPVNRSAVAELSACSSNITAGEVGHIGRVGREEHALEVQLPFLQTVLSQFRIVPLVFHDYSWENCRRLAEAIVSVFDPQKTLLVASSDLYHGHSYEECRRQDAATLLSLENDAAEAFCGRAAAGEVMACGAGPITVVKHVAELWGASPPCVVARTNSADVVGNEHGYVVGYAAAVITL